MNLYYGNKTAKSLACSSCKERLNNGESDRFGRGLKLPRIILLCS